MDDRQNLIVAPETEERHETTDPPRPALERMDESELTALRDEIDAVLREKHERLKAEAWQRIEAEAAAVGLFVEIRDKPRRGRKPKSAKR